MAIGTLFLIPNTLGTEDRLEQLSWVLPAATITQAAELKYWIVENAKTARAFLKAIDSVSSLCTPLQELVLLEWRGAAQNAKYNSQTRPESLLQALVDGHNMGLMSEAGVPGLADPGAELILAAHGLGASVKPLVGPSSILLGLMASGLNGQQFAFQGYLPNQNQERLNRLKQLEAESRRLQQTQIWIETPYRNAAMYDACLQALSAETRLCIGVDLSLASESIHTYTLSGWRKRFPSEKMSSGLQNRPAIFLLLA